LLIGADDFHEFYLKYLCSQNDVQTTNGRQQVVRLMGESVRKTESPTLIDTFAQRTAQRLGVMADAIRQEFKKFSTVKTSAPADSEIEPSSAESKAPRPSEREVWLLRLLLLHDELVGSVALHLDASWISHPLARQIVVQRLAAQTNETWRNLAAFLDQCETPEMRNLITEVVAEDRKIPNPEQQLADLVKAMRNQFLDRRIAACLQRASQPETSEAERVKLLREQEALRRQKQQPLTA
jgi:DNA primase